MIQPNEIRVGNRIAPTRPYPPGNKAHIICDEDFLEVLFGARDYDNYEGIPLTPEILEKCGFVYTEPADKLNDGYYDLGYRFRFVYIKGEGLLFLPNGHSLINRWYKHLHQLQNLYFAL